MNTVRFVLQRAKRRVLLFSSKVHCTVFAGHRIYKRGKGFEASRAPQSSKRSVLNSLQHLIQLKQVAERKPVLI